MTLGIALPGTALGLWRNPVAALFSTGEQGTWYDPSDLSTLFQDSAGTTPVTAVGQPVGLILDKSGRGNHASQATAASRPTLRQDASGYYYLEFDGVDDSLATGSVDFSATDKMTVWAGLVKNSDAAAGTVIGLSSAPTNLGSFELIASFPTASGGYEWSSSGSTRVAVNNTGLASSAVVTLSADISAPLLNGRVNSVQAINSASSQGTGTFSNNPLYIGRRGGSSTPFNGRLYSLVVRGAATDSSLLSRVERHVGGRMGIAL